jgi:Asp-tRNA(Asn)/Glu-tRNA(Gln) amidotransferase C subunit
MAKEVGVIVELARDGAVDRNLRVDTPPSIKSGRVVLDHLPRDQDGRLSPPRAGQVVMSVPSPETLRRDQDEVRHSVAETDTGDEPPVIIVEAAEYLREDELAPVLDAADLADRTVILRVLADA